jgi:methylated-DNA-protein-cysteine methyltransferase-like protein
MALRRLPTGTRIPWHRVINAQGRISLPEGSASQLTQRERLEAEGILFRINGSIDLRQFGLDKH